MMNKEVERLLIIIGERVINNKVPVVETSYDPETKQKIFTIPGEDKKLVIDPDDSLGFFDAVNGPAL